MSLDGRENTLLLRCRLCVIAEPGCVRGVIAPGARLMRPPIKFEDEDRCNVDLPISVRLFPEDDRWKDGCGGLLGASDMRDDDCDRPCCAAYGM